MPEKFDVAMAFDVHVGLPADKVDGFRRVMEEQDCETYADGDGWEVWGDKIGEAGNDDIAHVIVRLIDADEAILVAHNIALGYSKELIPMRLQSHEANNGIVASVTRSEDWAETLLNIHTDGENLTAKYMAMTVPVQP